MKRRRSDLLINLFLLLLVCVLYAATGEHDLGRSLSAMTMAPVYRGGGEAVALLCKLDYDAAALDDILQTLEDADTRITFAVSGAWAQEHPEELARLTASQELAVTGATLAEAKACRTALASAGAQARFYYGAPTTQASRIARKLRLTHIQATADALCARGSAENVLLRVSNAAAKGSIIMVQPTNVFAAALPEILTELQTKGLRVASVSDAIGTQ